MDQNTQDTIVSTPDTGTTKQNDPFAAEVPNRMNVVFIGAALVLVALLGGILFFLDRADAPQPETTLPPVVTEDGSFTGPDATVEALSQQSSSDEIADIEADLSATDLDAVSADIDSL
jgi:hypothetical protein